jgi:acyl-CoA synthetase (AMP-forming)/AMP-acid ligase II
MTGPSPLLATIPGLLAARAAAQPDRTAVLVAGRGTLTFAGWNERSAAVADALAGLGVRRGDRVGLLFGTADWIDYVVGFAGVHRAGAVAVPISDALAPPEVEYVLRHSGAVGLIHGTGEPPAGLPGWAVGLAELPAGGVAAPDATGPGRPIGPDDPAQVLYTSGTTGRPKGVLATHGNLTWGCGGRRRPLAHSEHFLHAFPVGTNAGQAMLVNALDAHPAALVAPRFLPGRVGRLIESYGVGTVFVVPAMASELLSARVPERYDLSSVRLLGCTAAALPPAVAAALAAALPRATIVNYYTSTEAAPAQTTMVVDPDRPASVGRAVGGGLRIADERGRPLPAGEIGEVCLRSPAAPRCYLNDPAASAAVFSEGWVRMGDLGYLDADGYLHLVDRDRDVIKSGAHKVSTLQVEAALYEHPAIVEAAVFGLPHPVLGMSVAAALVLGGDARLAELRGFLAERLAGHEIPGKVLVLPELPRNPGGKVLKARLRELAADPDTPALRATQTAAADTTAGNQTTAGSAGGCVPPRPDALAEPAPAGRGEPASIRDPARTGATR